MTGVSPKYFWLCVQVIHSTVEGEGRQEPSYPKIHVSVAKKESGDVPDGVGVGGSIDSNLLEHARILT